MDTKAVERISKALGDPYRIKIIEKIRKGGNLTACSAILDLCGLSQSTVSHHLKQLVDADLLIATKEGRNIGYELNKEVFSAYANYLHQFQD